MPRSTAELVAHARENATTCTCVEAVTWIERNPDGHLIDVREPPEHAAGAIPGSKNIPRGVVEFQIDAVCSDGPEAPILLFCASGGRAALAALALAELGYSNVTAVTGSFGDLSKLLVDR